jgi:hypothetical protein
MVGGFRSYNDSGRYTQIDNDKEARTFKSQNDFFLGARLINSWGGYFMTTQTLSNFNNSVKDKWVAADSSITLLHPLWYQGDQWKVSGAFRQYLQTSEYSKQNNAHQTAYYVALTAYSGRWDYFNILIPRYFSKDNMQTTDSTYYLEDRSTISQNINSWLKLGFGQWSQVEAHNNSGTGTCIEIYPYIDFIFNKTTFISTRFSFPIHANGKVYDGPPEASKDYGYTEVFLETTL